MTDEVVAALARVMARTAAAAAQHALDLAPGDTNLPAVVTAAPANGFATVQLVGATQSISVRVPSNLTSSVLNGSAVTVRFADSGDTMIVAVL